MSEACSYNHTICARIPRSATSVSAENVNTSDGFPSRIATAFVYRNPFCKKPARLRVTDVSLQDMTTPVCVEDGPGIVREIREHHAAWTLAQRMQAGQV
jgi:hypothetical protein